MTKKYTYNKIAVRELEVFTDNNPTLYRRIIKPTLINLAKKKEKGLYDKEKALKSYKRIADMGAKEYYKEFGTGSYFSVGDRKQVAKELEKNYRDELKDYVPKKKKSKYKN